jgi:transcriptional regulator with XRE-family HTH domain
METNRLKYIREALFKKSQKQFAEMLGVSQPTYSDFERRDSLPFSHQQTVRREAQALPDIEWSDSLFFEAVSS